MGKVCQLSRIWHLWAILSQGLFFKAPPERLAAGADVDIDHVTHFCMRLQARMKKGSFSWDFKLLTDIFKAMTWALFRTGWEL